MDAIRYFAMSYKEKRKRPERNYDRKKWAIARR
jgi:hypothetical protein